MKIVFFSDTHLNRHDESKTRIVTTFLSEVCRDADVVFLLGDLFEFYHGHNGIYPWYLPVADALKDIGGKGTKIYFIEGNHEYDVGKFFESYTGAVCTESVSMEVDGKRLFVAHGDAFVGGALRTVLKSKLTARVMDILGPRLTWTLAMVARVFLSQTKKAYNPKAVDAFRDYARGKFREGFDAVVMAHSHSPDRIDEGPEEKKKVYLNTGDFFAFSTYVAYETGKGFEIRKHPYAWKRAR